MVRGTPPGKPGRPAIDEKTKRSVQLQVNVTEGEARALNYLVNKYNLDLSVADPPTKISVSDYLRILVLEDLEANQSLLVKALDQGTKEDLQTMGKVKVESLKHPPAIPLQTGGFWAKVAGIFGARTGRKP